MHAVQITDERGNRRCGVVRGGDVVLVEKYNTLYAAAEAAIAADRRLTDVLNEALGDERISYDDLYHGRGDWRLLPAFDHPDEPACCFVTGTGLSHRKSADNRQAMHEAAGQPGSVSDSMKMYELGLAGGKPAPGEVGVQPEWFYKCNGTRLRAHGQPLEVPGFGFDGGEEAEPVGVYLVGPGGTPFRVGFAAGNEFSDHVLEQQNYLYLSSSKLRACSLGPELVIDEPFDDIRGEARVERGGETVWRAELATGEVNMCHSLANLEHHHFKYPEHRRAGDVHLHFFGADAFSYGDGFTLEDGDVMVVDYPAFGRALRNPMRVEPGPVPFVPVKVL